MQWQNGKEVLPKAQTNVHDCTFGFTMQLLSTSVSLVLDWIYSA